MTRTDVADHMGWSRQTIGRMESGSTRPTWSDVAGLCRVYDVPDAMRSELEERARQARFELEGRQTKALEDSPEWLTMFVQAERDADSIRIYESELITGLMQTPSYLRALHAVDPIMVDHEISESALRGRMQRQRDVLGEGRKAGSSLSVVMNEVALLRRFGTEEEEAEQRLKLLACAAAPNVDLRILPLTAGLHAAMSGPFTILCFASKLDSDVVYLHARDGARFREEPKIVSMFRTIFDEIHAGSIPIEEYMWHPTGARAPGHRGRVTA